MPSVAMVPGAMQMVRMPNRLHSRDSPVARFSSAARAELACTIEAMPRRGENAMKKIAPDRCGIIARTATSRVTAHVASTASRCTARQPLLVICSAGAENCPPALLTRVSIRPNRSSARSTMR